MTAVVDLVDRSREWGGRRLGLRDGALLVLRSRGMSADEIRGLRSWDVRQDPHEGGLHVSVAGTGGRRIYTLTSFQAGWLLEYLEAERAWGQARPLFCDEDGRPLSKSALYKIEGWYRRQVRGARPEARAAAR